MRSSRYLPLPLHAQHGGRGLEGIGGSAVILLKASLRQKNNNFQIQFYQHKNGGIMFFLVQWLTWVTFAKRGRDKKKVRV